MSTVIGLQRNVAIEEIEYIFEFIFSGGPLFDNENGPTTMEM